MCNEYDQIIWKAYTEMMQGVEWGYGTVVQLPGLDLPAEKAGKVKISDPAAIILLGQDGKPTARALRWAWPPTHGRGGPVFNIRSETRDDPPADRALSPFEAFYEFRDDGGKQKSKFEFRPTSNEPRAFPVILRDDRFSLMTAEPGPDVAPIHRREAVSLPMSEWKRWLEDPAWPAEIIGPSPAGTFKSVQVR